MSRYAPVRPAAILPPDPGLLRWVKSLVVAGALLVLLFPEARSQGYWLGWTPLWLLGMPLVAWWSLHRFRLPFRATMDSVATAGPGRRRRFGGQARRCARPSRRMLLGRAA